MVKVALAQFIWLVAPPTCTPQLAQVSSLIFCRKVHFYVAMAHFRSAVFFNFHSVQQSLLISTSSIVLVRAIQSSWPKNHMQQTNKQNMHQWPLKIHEYCKKVTNKQMQPLNSTIFTCLTSSGSREYSGTILVHVCCPAPPLYHPYHPNPHHQLCVAQFMWIIDEVKAGCRCYSIDVQRANISNTTYETSLYLLCPRPYNTWVIS